MKDRSFKSGYAKYYDFFNRDKNYGEEVKFLDSVFEKYSKFKVNSILNLGCGTGMHELSLSKRNYSLTGLDLSKEMIEIAQSRNIKNAKFSVVDMSNFSLNKKFDACISMFASFGYLLGNKQIESSIKCVKKHLNKNGIFLIEVWNGLGVIRELPSSRIKEIRDGRIMIKRQSFPKLDSFNHKVHINFMVDVFQDEKPIERYQESHEMRFFFPQEIKHYLENAGLTVLEICKTFELGKGIDEKEWNMVVICQLK